MTSPETVRTRVPARRCGYIRRTISAAALVLLAATGALAGAPEDALTDADKTCLGCHGAEGMSKDLGGGKTLALHVAAGAYARSVHRAIGCGGCHADIKLDKHTQGGKAIKSARAYSVEMAAACRGCHEDLAKLNDSSVHAARFKAGNEWAPMCTDCHSAHAVMPKTAYETCVTCHDSALAAHRKWLPNSALHFEVVSCAACHVPAAKRMVDLRLYDHGGKKWVTEPEDAPAFEKLAKAADADGNGLDAAELRALMAQLNPDSKAPQKTLRGRIELRAGAETHQFADKTRALRDCASCHRQGAEPFQRVTVSITGADGKPLRYDAHPDVLGSVLSVESLREFYAVGGTRNILLDALFVLAVLGGLAVPIGHQILKRIVTRTEAAQAGKSAGDTAGAPGQAGDRRGVGDDSATRGPH